MPTSLHCVRKSDALARRVCLTVLLSVFACNVSHLTGSMPFVLKLQAILVVDEHPA